MASLPEAQLGAFCLESPWRVSVFLALFPILFVACILFLLVSGILAFPVCLAWFIHVAAQEELDLFSFPVVLQSVAEDIAAIAGLKQELALIIIDQEDNNQEYNNYCCVSLRTKLIHPRRESFISDFNESEDGLSRGDPRKQDCLPSSGTKLTVSGITAGVPYQSKSYSILSVGIDSLSTPSSISQSPSPSYHSITSIMSTEDSIKTPEQKLFDFSRRTISPHWSVGRPITKSGTPSPLELSPGELEYPDSYMPSPKRWPSPISDEGYLACREESLRIKLQKATFSEYVEANDRMFFADNIGNTHLYEAESLAHPDTKSDQPISYLSQDYNLSTISPRLERKLFPANSEDKDLANSDASFPKNPACETMHTVPLTGYNNETALTIGWSHRYRDLITELKGSLGKKEDEDEDQPKTENPNPIIDIDPHWMDFPRLEPLQRPHLNKLQRWGLTRTNSEANLRDRATGEIRQNTAPKHIDFPSLEVSPFTLKEDYNFGNLGMSPEGRGTQSGYENGECYKSYWEGFDETYIIHESKSPGDNSDDGEKWKHPMAKWAEKGVEVMKSVDEESRDNFDGSILLSPSSRKAVHWSSPLSDSSEREPLLLHHESLVIDDENINGSYRITYIEDLMPRTPSPLLVVLEGKDGLHEEDKKETVPLEETSNRLFGRRLARASRFPVAPPNTLTTPPRPLPEKLIRMFEDLSKPQPTSPRPSSINSSPGRINCSPERNNSSPERTEGPHGKEVRGLGLDLGDAAQVISPHEIRGRLVFSPRSNDDGLNECF